MKKNINHQNLNIPIIYEDNNIIIVHKPIKMECINKTENNLIKLLSKQLKNSDLKLIHRLDTNTSGLLIIAKNNDAYQLLLDLMKTNQIKKYYYALVYGHLSEKNKIIKAYLIKNPKQKMVKIKLTYEKNAKEIITKYKVIKEYKKYSLLEIELITGRTHQIRAHMNFINHPIVGEKKYISKIFDKDTRFKTQALIAYKIQFDIKTNNNLSYLNERIFKINKIDFLEKLF